MSGPGLYTLGEKKFVCVHNEPCAFHVLGFLISTMVGAGVEKLNGIILFSPQRTRFLTRFKR